MPRMPRVLPSSPFEVTDRGGEIAEPLELRLPHLPDVRRKRRPAELEQRAGPPDRDLDVVEELGVNVDDRAPSRAGTGAAGQNGVGMTRGVRFGRR